MRFRPAPFGRLAFIVAALACVPASAQQAQQAPVPQVQQAPAQPAPQPSGEWAKLPRMQLERQFAGPLQDTLIQRWRDPVDGTACYMYLPITAAHSPPAQGGFVQYGANVIGSISCFRPPSPAAVPTSRTSPTPH
ncbi:hypothetical protein [Bradyrhizobium neotropicale]|uniref:Uncharacterized protein n=1 Tax=Bradyrhizobium neotropicale TaxID=1497615 RepID=A0A176YXR2_9BRAD|nr:hypothetical protein [Bradyrhizobium neotropicale]OAF11575.1 hypothetical protein AXW67_22430 [Bradyrhizobium neotropicale]